MLGIDANILGVAQIATYCILFQKNQMQSCNPISAAPACRPEAPSKQPRVVDQFIPHLAAVGEWVMSPFVNINREMPFGSFNFPLI